MASPSERILITGSSGFTGRALARALLDRGYAVSGLSRGARLAWEREVELTASEGVGAVLREIEPDVVVHLAGVASPVHGSVAEIYEANVTGTASLLSSLRRAPRKPRLVLVASSAVVYARSEDGHTQREDDRLEPINDYGVSKLAVEQMCRLALRDLPIQVVRPFNYTGPGQSAAFLVPKIVDHFARDTGEIELGDLQLDRDISDLGDIVEAYVRLIAGPAGPTLNLCSGSPTHLASIVELLRQISGRSMAVRTNPAFVRFGEPKLIVGDRTALDGRIGVWPRRSLRDTLQTMYAVASGGGEAVDADGSRW
ncbi:MAG: NAD-dependent epimerase/dehydratase family protein [Caulobacteraceae bacterium]